MHSAVALRSQIEATLADRIPSALTPATRVFREVAPVGVGVLDEMLEGGLPLGALTEMVGLECSGRTALALSFVAQLTRTEKVCAWVDVSDALNPESAAASGVDLARLLWIRCGVSPVSKASMSPRNNYKLPEKYLVPPIAKKGLHSGGFGPHPRNEVKGLSDGVSGLLRAEVFAQGAAGFREPESGKQSVRPVLELTPFHPSRHKSLPIVSAKPWSRIDQALRVTDLLLQAGGFSAIVLDLGSIAPEHVSRIPLATWFRYRAAAERTQASVLLLTQHACSKSSAGLVLRLQSGEALDQETTVLAGLERHIEVSRQRFSHSSATVIPMRKPPQRASGVIWHSRTTWAGR
jgi:recombination protein RecA